MKKLLLSMLAFAAALGLDSCLGKPKIEDDPMQGGKYIYNYTHIQNFIANDLLNIGFRLNILLTEAAKQPDGDITKLIVRYNNSNINLTATLFGNATVETSSTIPGDYIIRYVQNYGVTNDIRRQGAVRVSTGGKLLTETEGGVKPVWSIEVESDELYCAYSNDTNIRVVTDEPMTVTADSDNEWHYEINGYKSSVYSDHASKWNTSGQISFNYHSMDYDNVLGGKFTVNCQGDGITMYSLDAMTYRGTELVYSPKCGYAFTVSGTEFGRFDTSASINLTIFTALSSRLTWNSSDCKLSAMMEYDNMTEKVI